MTGRTVFTNPGALKCKGGGKQAAGRVEDGAACTRSEAIGKKTTSAVGVRPCPDGTSTAMMVDTVPASSSSPPASTGATSFPVGYRREVFALETINAAPAKTIMFIMMIFLWAGVRRPHPRATCSGNPRTHSNVSWHRRATPTFYGKELNDGMKAPQ